MMARFDVPAESTLRIPFMSYGSDGASLTLSGLAVTDIEIYKNGSTTQRASDAGYTLLDTDGIDFDGIVGLNGFSIDLSNNTDSGFFTVGDEYWVVVASVTIDGEVVNTTVAWFRIVAEEASVGYPSVDVASIAGTSAPSMIALSVWSATLEGSKTAAELMRLYAAALGGKSLGLDTTTAVYRNLEDDTDVITATVDQYGNRSAVTLDLTY